jgi:hypothetical protein
MVVWADDESDFYERKSLFFSGGIANLSIHCSSGAVHKKDCELLK